MILGTPDFGYGSTGASVSTVPVNYQIGPAIINDPGVETHYIGGRAVAVHLLASEIPAMLVAGHDHWIGGNGARRIVSIVLAEVSPDFARQGMPVRALSSASQDTDVLASSPISSSRCLVLVRLTRTVPPSVDPREYQLWTVGGPTLLAVNNVSTQNVPAAALHDRAGGARIAHANGQTAVVSASGTKLRVAVFGPSGAPSISDMALAPAGNRLSGLTGLFVASVRFVGTGLSIALTAEQTLPGVGAVSQAVILRLLASGAQDPAYGEDGMWVSPLGPSNRSFRCAGETPSGVAGHDGSRLVLYGIRPDGGQTPQPGDPAGGLVDGFGTDGIVTVPLPGQVQRCALVSDASRMWLAAQCLPSGGDQQVVVTRLAVADGALDQGFGEGGLAPIQLEEPGLELGGLVMQPARLAVHPNPPQPARLMVAVSRSTDGLDCDHLPTLVALAPNTGLRVEMFGYGGTALFSGVGPPAVVLGDGSALVHYRLAPREAPATRFRRLTPDGRLGELLEVAVPSRGAYVHDLTRGENGTLLVSGAGPDGWVAKMNSDLSLDERFGQGGGFAIPRPGDSNLAMVLGVNPDGTIAVQVSGGGVGYLCRLSNAGKLDTTYGVNGFLRLEAFGHLGGGPATGASSFLDSDGEVMVVVQGGSPLQIALRRVTAQGQYDPTFGIGQPSVNPPPSNRAITLHSPPTESGSGPRYRSFASAGIAWLGRPRGRGRTLYLVGTATAGGELVSSTIGGLAVRRPAYPVLVVTAWTTQGERATSAIPGGAQEGGVLPFLYWYASGVLPESSTSLLVYGGGGTPREIQSQVAGGPVITQTIAQRPGPALFRVTHPGGIDFGFGDHGAAVMQVPDFVPSVFAGALSASGDRITLMHADLAEYQRNASYRSRFGGLARFI